MYKNSVIKIEKNKNIYCLKVKNYLNNAFFIKTFVEPVLSGNSKLEKEEIKIALIVNDVISLEDLIKKKKMTIELLELLFNSLEQQLKELEQTNHTISNFSPKHIFLFESKILNSLTNILIKFLFNK